MTSRIGNPKKIKAAPRVESCYSSSIHYSDCERANIRYRTCITVKLKEVSFAIWKTLTERLALSLLIKQDYIASITSSKSSLPFALPLGLPNRLTSFPDKSSNAFSRVISLAFKFCKMHFRLQTERT